MTAIRVGQLQSWPALAALCLSNAEWLSQSDLSRLHLQNAMSLGFQCMTVCAH